MITEQDAPSANRHAFRLLLHEVLVGGIELTQDEVDMVSSLWFRGIVYEPNVTQTIRLLSTGLMTCSKSPGSYYVPTDKLIAELQQLERFVSL